MNVGDQTGLPAGDPGALRIAVIIATVGRAAMTRAAIERLARQSRRPDRLIVVGANESDIAGLDGLALPVEKHLAPRGLCSQRNSGLDRAGDNVDVVVFFDDDFLPADGFLAEVERLFALRPDVVGACGRVIADGANGPGIAFDDAVQILEAATTSYKPEDLQARMGLYGCNMAYRVSATGGLRFDEGLPLYGWQEDFDFSYQIGQRGKLVRSAAFYGVHLGVKAGRTSGKRLGYSQIANPIYLMKKRTMPLKRGLRLMRDNVAANIVRSMAPEPHVDRLGRLMGNLRAIGDLATRRLDPRRILEFD